MAAIEPGFLLIRGARLADPARRRAEAADVLIRDGIIRELGSGLAAPEGTRIIEANGLLIHPGLINAHTHGHTGLSKGQGDKWTLELLLAAAPWIGGNRATADKKLSAMICAAEMVAKGCTAAYDLYYEFPLPTREGLDATAEAYAEIGMRAVIAPMVADRTMYEAIPGLMDALPDALQRQVERLRLMPWQQTLSAIGDVLKHWRWSGQDILPAIAPTIPLHCADEFMCGCARLAREHGVGLHSHVGESKVQAVAGMKRYGKTLVAHLDELGLLGPDFTAAHAVWLDDDDLKRMAAHGASMAHNPGSNMRLGNGMFRLRQALDAGVNIGIGTDGASCADNQNMYEAMRYASMVSKVQGPDPRLWATSEEVYRAATLGSAQALGFRGLGAVAPDMKADIVFLDLNALNWIPHNWTTNQIVHTEDGTAVKHVMIGGRFVFRDGRHTTIDLAKLAAEVEAARERLEALNAEWHGFYQRLEPVVASFCPAIAAQPYHLRRYLCDAPRN
ncbi:amidohydrolase family protein [Siccirubricoccus sp. G192]|uniref:amidohydrolase family protein n=1 Tax=Siccirubricoccus sp. G192 TaxID=2849651 RepID=UPI001C2B8656|nr:amidohydrolase family protein [Siccirubricoccus sp. G192]MBV1796502.1 amidohydrolase family protein [Siccirubricoccus sp. G192]